MRRIIGYILSLLLFSVSLTANDTIRVPLKMSTFAYLPQDGPTGSTPDPTDPNQFRVSLVGNVLLVETQKDAVSYVVIQESQSEIINEDYFYGISFGTISCPISHAGQYDIRIGYWKTNFMGTLLVRKFSLFDYDGRFWGNTLERTNTLPIGLYFIRIETPQGSTTAKIYKCQ